MQSRLEDGWRGELKQKVAAKYGEGLKGQKGGCWWWGVVGVGVGGRGGGGVAQTEACGANCACQAAAAAKEQIKWYVNVYHSLLKMITVACWALFWVFSFTYFWAVRSQILMISNYASRNFVEEIQYCSNWVRPRKNFGAARLGSAGSGLESIIFWG